MPPVNEQLVQKPGEEALSVADAASSIKGVKLKDPSLQDLSDIGGFSPVSADASKLPSIVNQPEVISQGSEQVRDVSAQAKDLKKEIPQIRLQPSDTVSLQSPTGNVLSVRVEDIGAFPDFTPVDEDGIRAVASFKKTQEETEAKEKADKAKPDDITTGETVAETKTVDDFMADVSRLTGLTTTEKEQVQIEVDRVKAEFDEIIRKAEAEKARSLGVSEVQAGERGGSMSTQFAGAAAEPREISQRIFEDRFGAGGELSVLKSDFDDTISSLEAKKVSAVNSARSAAQAAIKEGKVADLDLALKLADEARAVEEEQRAASEAFTEATRAKLKEAREELTFELDTTERIRSQAVQQLKDFSDSGISPDVIPDDIKEKFEADLNLPGGAFDSFFEKSTRGELLSLSDSKSLGLPFGTTQEDAVDLGIIPAGSDAANFDIRTVGNQVVRTDKTTGESEVIFEGSADSFSNTFSFRKEFIDNSKDFKLVRDAMGRIEAAAERKSAAGDLALIFNFMKVLDPGSVVRESEFATAQNAAGVPERIRNAWNKIQYGTRLGPPSEEEKALFGDQSREDAKSEAETELEGQREDFVNTARDLFNSQVDVQQDRQDENRRTAEAFGLDPLKSVPDLIDPRKDVVRETGAVVLPETGFVSVDQFLTEATDEQVKFINGLAVDVGINEGDDEKMLDLIQTTIEEQIKIKEGIEDVSNIELGSNLAQKNNNPGNLRLNNQEGASEGSGGFAKFETAEQGVEALKNDLKAKITGNSPAIRSKLGRDAETLFDVVSVFAPKDDGNDPESYSAFVAREMGISPNEPVENLINRLDELTRAFAKKESSSTIA